jgi:hypothetical protein
MNQRGPGQPTGPRKTFKTRPVGTSRAAILRRLRRDHAQLYELVLSGEITPFRAACVAGFRRPPGRTPKLPADPTEPGHHDVLLELWLGAHPDRGSVFETREQLQAAWVRHRDEVMRLWGTRGRRPMGFYEFELCEDHPGYDAEPRFLYERGLLSPDERTQYEATKKEPLAAEATQGSKSV